VRVLFEVPFIEYGRKSRGLSRTIWIVCVRLILLLFGPYNSLGNLAFKACSARVNQIAFPRSSITVEEVKSRLYPLLQRAYISLRRASNFPVA